MRSPFDNDLNFFKSFEFDSERGLLKSRQVKYFKKEMGGNGKWRYYYTEAEYKKAKGMSGGDGEKSNVDKSEMEIIEGKIKEVAKGSGTYQEFLSKLSNINGLSKFVSKDNFSSMDEARNYLKKIFDENERKVEDNNESKFDFAISDFNKKYRSADIEYALMVDDEGQTILNKTSYSKGSVSFTKEEILNVQHFSLRNKGVVFTHNHPSGSSFSQEDFLMTIIMGVKEMRAVGVINGENVEYILRRKHDFKYRMDLNDHSLLRYMSEYINDLAKECKDEINLKWDNDPIIKEKVENGTIVGYSKKEFAHQITELMISKLEKDNEKNENFAFTYERRILK